MNDNFYNIILDGNIVKGKPGESILDLARRHDVDIPTLCNDDRLEPFTSCYVCVVEVEGMRGHQPACSTRIAEGMKMIPPTMKASANHAKWHWSLCSPTIMPIVSDPASKHVRQEWMSRVIFPW